jgi:hypothetical protein
MTNTKSDIEIITVSTLNFTNKVLVIFEQPVIGGGINETKQDNIIYDASIVYEF